MMKLVKFSNFFLLFLSSQLTEICCNTSSSETTSIDISELIEESKTSTSQGDFASIDKIAVRIGNQAFTSKEVEMVDNIESFLHAHQEQLGFLACPMGLGATISLSIQFKKMMEERKGFEEQDRASNILDAMRGMMVDKNASFNEKLKEVYGFTESFFKRFVNAKSSAIMYVMQIKPLSQPTAQKVAAFISQKEGLESLVTYSYKKCIAPKSSTEAQLEKLWISHKSIKASDIDKAELALLSKLNIDEIESVETEADSESKIFYKLEDVKSSANINNEQEKEISTIIGQEAFAKFCQKDLVEIVKNLGITITTY